MYRCIRSNYVPAYNKTPNDDVATPSFPKLGGAGGREVAGLDFKGGRKTRLRIWAYTTFFCIPFFLNEVNRLNSI